MFLIFKSYELCSTFLKRLCGRLLGLPHKFNQPILGVSLFVFFFYSSTNSSKVFDIIIWTSTAANKSQFIFRNLVQFQQSVSCCAFMCFMLFFFFFCLHVTQDQIQSLQGPLHICTGDCAKIHHVPAVIKKVTLISCFLMICFYNIIVIKV